MNAAASPFAQDGCLDWIGRRPQSHAPVEACTEVVLEVGRGLVGDHYQKEGGSRQVTLIQAEHLGAVAAMIDGEVRPEALRRNLVVSGINLAALQQRRFRIGEVLLEGSGDCPPCHWMEENLGPGGLQAMCGHGGITARVLEGGRVRVGDSVQPYLGGQ